VTARNRRHRAREFALKALYEWQLSRNDIRDIRAGLAEEEGYAEIDGEYFRQIADGVVEQRERLDAALAPVLDRAPDALSPVEHGVLLIGAYELAHAPDVPYRVVINEAVELAKSYGGTDGHKYVNGVLDKLAATLRPGERSK
jgi:transcription antitermination protein NusB